MTNYIVIYWLPNDDMFDYKVFEDYGRAITFAQEKKQIGRKDVILAKKVGAKYQLVKFGYSKIFALQNKVINLLAIMLVAFICYLYYKYFKR